jgi:hypothetical protein
MNYRIKNIEVVRYPVLRIIFDDDLSGEYDLTSMITTGPAFARLKDQAYFNTVAVGEDGRVFGWNLEERGHEIDFCSDAARILIETQKVEEMAQHYQASRSAAE